MKKIMPLTNWEKEIYGQAFRNGFYAGLIYGLVFVAATILIIVLFISVHHQ